MHTMNYILAQFRKAEDYPEATEDIFMEYLNNLVNSSATDEEEAYEVLVEYLEFLNVDPDSLNLYKKENHFEVDFPS